MYMKIQRPVFETFTHPMPYDQCNLGVRATHAIHVIPATTKMQQSNKQQTLLENRLQESNKQQTLLHRKQAEKPFSNKYRLPWSNKTEHAKQEENKSRTRREQSLHYRRPFLPLKVQGVNLLILASSRCVSGRGRCSVEQLVGVFGRA